MSTSVSPTIIINVQAQPVLDYTNIKGFNTTNLNFQQDLWAQQL